MMAQKKKNRTRKKSAAKKAAPKKPRRQRMLRRAEPERGTAGPVEARAIARYIRVSPQKARLVIDLIRGLDAGQALQLLAFTRKRVAREVEKVLRSAIANAENKSEDVDVDRLYVKHAVVNEGFRFKRIRPAPMGRAYIYQRRTSHIEVAVAERGAPAVPVTRAEGPAEATA